MRVGRGVGQKEKKKGFKPHLEQLHGGHRGRMGLSCLEDRPVEFVNDLLF